MDVIAQNIKETIEKETNLKFSVKKGVGSMRGYTIFSVKKQGDFYPEIPFEIRQKIKADFKSKNSNHPTFVSGTQVDIYLA
jgi:hypothetical protein